VDLLSHSKRVEKIIIYLLLHKQSEEFIKELVSVLKFKLIHSTKKDFLGIANHFLTQVEKNAKVFANPDHYIPMIEKDINQAIEPYFLFKSSGTDIRVLSTNSKIPELFSIPSSYYSAILGYLQKIIPLPKKAISIAEVTHIVRGLVDPFLKALQVLEMDISSDKCIYDFIINKEKYVKRINNRLYREDCQDTVNNILKRFHLTDFYKAFSKKARITRKDFLEWILKKSSSTLIFPGEVVESHSDYRSIKEVFEESIDLISQKTKEVLEKDLRNSNRKTKYLEPHERLLYKYFLLKYTDKRGFKSRFSSLMKDIKEYVIDSSYIVENYLLISYTASWIIKNLIKEYNLFHKIHKQVPHLIFPQYLPPDERRAYKIIGALFSLIPDHPVIIHYHKTVYHKRIMIKEFRWLVSIPIFVVIASLFEIDKKYIASVIADLLEEVSRLNFRENYVIYLDVSSSLKAIANYIVEEIKKEKVFINDSLFQ
jgi:hypothetical protein